MDTVYLICAIIGGTLLAGQFVLSLLGVGHTDHDGSFHDASGDHDHGSSWFAGVLSFGAITAAIMLFGLVGLFAISSGRDFMGSLGLALLGGVAGMLLVAQLMKMLHNLAEDGNVQIEQSVGMPATVYLTIPGNRAGAGKVTLNLQNRTVEYQAITAHPESLPTGANATVVGVVNSDTVEVSPAALAEAQQHA